MNDDKNKHTIQRCSRGNDPGQSQNETDSTNPNEREEIVNRTSKAMQQANNDVGNQIN